MTIQPPINPPSYNQEQIEDDFSENQSILDIVEEMRRLAEEILSEWSSPSFNPEKKLVLRDIKTKLEEAKSRLD